jgi:chorismate synthase
VASQKFGGHNDYRGGGHFSGRVTLGLVAAGVVAKKMLDGVKISASIVEVGGVTDPAMFQDIVKEAVAEGNSVGGVVECRATGVPVGWGEPFFDSVESVAAHLLFSIPAVKGVEFGSGFAGSRLRGSTNNDPIIASDGTTATNNAGGINGGITNGNKLVVRIAVKPTASISVPQQTWNFGTGRVEELTIGGRHDACITLRVPPVAEAAVAIALADLKLTNL